MSLEAAITIFVSASAVRIDPPSGFQICTMNIEYRTNHRISVDEFISLLKRSGLAERRPIDDRDCLSGMLTHCNLLVTAWAEEVVVGVARSVTDFHYACYLSDLAVDTAFQKHGIGIELQRRTQDQIGPRCKLILLAAPLANGYYPKIGYSNNPHCWVIGKDRRIG